MKGEADDAGDFAGEVAVFEDQFGDEEACVAVNGCDANVSRHNGLAW